MTNKISLDKTYSTTRFLTKEKPGIVSNPKDKFESVLFLPKDENQKGEGGLRTQGYFKKSYDNKPLISIVTVVYNGEEFLEETIQSVINQTYDNVEYIIIDGGSTDKTLDIIKQYDNQIDYWVSEKDSGIYDAMNKGIKVTGGDYVAIANADDTLYYDTVRKICDVVVSDNNIMFTYGNLDVVDRHNKKIYQASSLGIEHIKYKLFKHMPYLHPTMFIRRNVYKLVGLYDTRYRVSADYDFCLKLVQDHALRSIDLEFSTGKFRLGGVSGGFRSYLENHKLLLKHNVNPILVTINTLILATKLMIRKIRI